MSLKVSLHFAEKFLNWYPRHTKLYIRGENRADHERKRELNIELFDALAPFLDDIYLRGVADGVRKGLEDAKNER